MEEDLEFKKNFKISAIERRKDRLKEDIAKVGIYEINCTGEIVIDMAVVLVF